MDNYERLNTIGEGTYGVVMRCRHKHSGMVVAIKRFKEKDEEGAVRKTALREVRILKSLRHENIVNLIEVFRQGGKLYLVFEYVERTVLDDLERHKHGMPLLEVLKITWQLLRSIDYCHSHNIMHRDVKPENLLLTRSGVLKLCDFGFAREVIGDGEYGDYTDYVATRWYRSPELLVGAVDIWAIGCLFCELLTGVPLFAGETDLDQLALIVRVIGPLIEEHEEAFLSNPLYDGVHPPGVTSPVTLDAHLPTLDPTSLGFVKVEKRTVFTFESFREWFPQELRQIAERDRQDLISALKRTRKTDPTYGKHLLPVEEEEQTERPKDQPLQNT
eukprot:m51a1_g13888 putative cmgc cdkl protein kinase (331) ;mRNA; r:670355-671914